MSITRNDASRRIGIHHVGVLLVEVFENPRSFGLAFSAYGERTVLTICGDPSADELESFIDDCLQNDHGFSAGAAQLAAENVLGAFYLIAGF